MRYSLLAALFLGLGGIAGTAAAQPANPDAKAMECAENGDFICALRSFSAFMMSDQAAPLENPDGDLTVAGARWEVFVRLAVPQLGNLAARNEVERLLEFVRAEYGDTRYMYATLHMVRAETCAALGDAACAEDSKSALCENLENWAAPFAMPAQGAEMTERVKAVTSECEE
ncbi:hypothetical protein [Rhodovulum marinum]|uniref:Uncharacterized protein n=1 Tax=Rhodovulum marinum TaxID=320662 RepID=A0A4V2SRI0_9RHOB|nr:hypothetical protein [Rhodovulum marinum]TCP42986.1 hypothetical protein EV662_102178 [Rhodovulum marinum]